MALEFDPYYKWLGIPPKDQPPHHYRLLGIELFEDDRDVIDAAANRVMAYLKDLATGDEAEHSQSLLNEVSRARICLLNKKKKAAYDEELRGKLPPQGGAKEAVRKPGAKPPVKKVAESPEGKTLPAKPPVKKTAPLIRTVERRPKPAAGAITFPEPNGRRQMRTSQDVRWKLIAAVAAGAAGVCLAVLIFVVAYLFLGRSESEMASVDNFLPPSDWPQTADEVSSQPDSEAGPESSDPGAEADPEADPETNPAKDSSSAPKTDITNGSKTAIGGQAETPPPFAAKPDPGSVPGEDMQLPVVPDTFTDSSPAGASNDDAMDTGSEKPKEEPTTVATTNGTPEPAKLKPLVDDTDLPKVDAPGATMPKEESSVPEKPEREKAKPARPPFQDLPLVISLPSLDAAEAASLQEIGLIHIPSGELCFAKLRGGENACKGAHSFVMNNADGGLAERDWEIMLRDGEAGPETKIAHLSIDDDSQFAFQWQPEAKNQTLSAQLCNCALSLNCGGQSHLMSLREPAVDKGLILEFEKPSSKDDWKIEAPPDPDGIKLEITGVGDAKYTIQPEPVMDADRGEVWVDLEDGGGLLTLKVETAMKRTLHMSVTPHVKSLTDGKPQKLIVRQLSQLITQMVTQERQLVFKVQQGTQMAPQAPTARDRAVIEQQVALAEQAQTEIQTALPHLQELAEFLKTATGNIELQFRVYYDADSSQIDLLRTGS